MQLLALLVIITVGGSIVLVGILPPDQVQAWVGPVGAVIFGAALLAAAFRLWLTINRIVQTARQVSSRVAAGIREPPRYGVPLQGSKPSGSDDRTRRR